MSLPVFLWKSLPKSGKSGEKGRETRPPPVGNLYPNSGKPGKRVENPALTVRKSLPKSRKTGKRVENPAAAGRESLPKQRKSAEKVENPSAAGWKSLPKSGKSVERVEKPGATVRKSLPKQPFLPGKGRDSKFRRSEISTQITKISRKG